MTSRDVQFTMDQAFRSTVFLKGYPLKCLWCHNPEGITSEQEFMWWMRKLLERRKKPEKFRDLIVRVAEYSDYFADIGKELQDEIIARTEHRSF